MSTSKAARRYVFPDDTYHSTGKKAIFGDGSELEIYFKDGEGYFVLNGENILKIDGDGISVTGDILINGSPVGTGSGGFTGTMDDITDGATYVKTENNYTDADAAKLAGIAAGAEVNVNADWNSVGGDSQILNKPTSMTPTSHAGSHISTGGDAIAAAVAGGASGLMTGSDKTKLDGIAAGAEVNVNADWNAGSGDAQILNKPSIPDDVSDLTDTSYIISGKKPYHGVETYADLAFSNANKALTLSAITYWYKGARYSTASTVTCDLDLVADRDNSANSLATNTLYFFYFKDATGKLYWSDTPWDFKENVFVATVFWNGSAGACQLECHGHQRDLDWHMWAHDTIGTRYESGAELTLPTTSTDGSLQIETGTFHDEDIDFETGQCVNMRGWHKTASDTYTFTDFSLPYVGTAGQPQWLDTDDFTLKNVGASDYVRMWVYASLDITRPIYVIPTHRATAYNTISDARNETAPVTIGTNVNSEYKLIYCFIYKGDGQLQETIDYRTTSPVPGGGTPSISASQVSFAPTGDISSTNVQSAINELDNEKVATSRVSDTAYDATSWDNNTDIPTKNAIRDKIESMTSGSGLSHIEVMSRISIGF